jgi:hypothetical protein
MQATIAVFVSNMLDRVSGCSVQMGYLNSIAVARWRKAHGQEALTVAARLVNTNVPCELTRETLDAHEVAFLRLTAHFWRGRVDAETFLTGRRP